MTAARLPRSPIEPVNPVLNVSRSANLPHVPGIRVGDYIFLSGMGPIDPVTGERRHGPIAEQVRTTLDNVKHMLESAGSSLERVVRVHVVLADIADLGEWTASIANSSGGSAARTAWSMQLRFANGCEIEAWRSSRDGVASRRADPSVLMCRKHVVGGSPFARQVNTRQAAHERPANRRLRHKFGRRVGSGEAVLLVWQEGPASPPLLRPWVVILHVHH